jgi:triphosphatase
MTETVRRGSAADSVIVTGRTALPVIAPDSTVGGGFAVMLAASIRTLRNATQRGEPDRPETVHRFRVGLRRLRSLLSAFRSVLPHDERRALGARLSALGKQYSRVREWDVFLSTTLQPMTQALHDEPALLELEACAREARRRALPNAVDFSALVNEIAVAIDTAIWLHYPRPEFTEQWQGNLKGFAEELLTKHHRRLRKRLKTVDLDQQPSFHQLRIDIKKVRYPIEMFRDLFDDDRIDRYLARVVAVQDALGHLNDALIARDLIADLPLSSRSQGLANGWLAREVEVCRQAFPSAAKQLRKAEPFWEKD